MSDQAHIFKILTIGESGVGKTCILRRYVENKFLANHLATIGIDFKTKTININGTEIRLKIWDTAGQDRFRNITNQYYRGADGIFLVFDLTDRVSFEKIQDWISQITTNTKQEEIGLVLLGNKSDAEKRVISTKEGEEKAKELKIKYFETSALNGLNITESFEYLAREIIEKKKLSIGDPEGNTINIGENNQQKKKSCC